MAEAVRVIVRCRPMNSREKGLDCKEVIKMDSKIAQCAIINPAESKKTPPKTFTFDGAYDTNSTTEAIYSDIGYPLVDGVLEGYNGTIFAYGQTGCGKSFSMQGIQDPVTQRGIIPRAFDHIFEAIQMTEGVKFLVHASYLEIYNEEIRDLLGQDAKKKLDLKEHPDRGVYCQGLSMHPCKGVHDCEKIMDKGWKNRSTGSTLMNADSSRSHSIFSIHMERCESDENGEEHIRAAKLNLVDLAGSERQAKTGATGDRLKEATKINLSLSALGNVISALVDGKSKHIPYRDSKLTRLLQDSLGGNTKTLMVACLSPADNNYDESLSTLRYANRAKNIKNKPKINEDPKDALLREFQDEITKLKAMLRGEIPVQLDGETTGPPPKAIGAPKGHASSHADPGAIEAEKARLREEFESERSNMKQQFDAMKMSKENLEVEMSKLQEQYQSQVASVEKGEYIASPGQKKSRRKVAPGSQSKQNRKNAKINGHVEDESLNGHVEDESLNGVEDESLNGVEDDTLNGVESSVENGASTYRILTGKPGEELVSVTSNDVNMQNEEDYGEEGEELLPVQSSVQQAVHLGSAVDEEGGMLAPRSSPTGDQPQNNPKHQEALKRLQELQQAMVGGEQVDNETLREKHKKKRKHVEERKRKLQEALALMDGEDIMLHIYDNVQDELKAKNKLLAKEREKAEAQRQEVLDLQSEFEFDRIDYLDTMRKQEQEIKWYKAVVEKIHPCLRRDCNYVNLDRIKAHSEWDTENQCWSLPKMTIEKNKLPPAGVMPGGRQDALPSYGKTNGEVQPSVYDDLRSEDKYLDKLNNRNDDISGQYFRSKRADRLLQRTDDDKRRGTSPNGPMTNGHGPPLNSLNSGSNSGVWNNNNGQLSTKDSPDMLMRKPMRLDALQPGGKSAKKKRGKYNMMEPL